tara:strand:+ start:172 stop:501 length:330 start_codon:yes stop_codon:yes gene_type:complete
MAKKEPNLSTDQGRTKYWTKYAKDRLVGRKIVSVAYLTSKECDKDFGWYKRPITFTLDDGKIVIAQMDDEGNDGGVLMIEYPGETTTSKHYPGKVFQKTDVLPVLSVDD